MVPNHPNERDDGVCPNCSAPLNGPFCSSCGQRQIDLDRPFREIADEAMESFLSFDARILRTLWPLIRRPGLLTVDFLAGRRVRYVHPFKLYFAFSVLLFLVLALSDYMVVRVGDSDAERVTGFRVDVSDSEEADDDAPVEPEEPSTFAKIFGPIGELAENDPDRLNRLFTDRLAKTIILIVPVFAALLKVLYWRRRYLAHLVFSLHLHSYAFLAMVVGLVIDMSLRMSEGQGPGNALAVLAIAVYSFLALRRVYGQGRLLTVGKMVGLLIFYIVALLATMFLALALTVVTI